ncbi:MAG: hypothetical protein H2069_04085 [Legionella sp.]|nr:hypothetical protein [Legionella sp.]
MRMFSGGNVHPTRLFFMMEVINCLCYFAPLSFIAIFLHDVKHLGNVEIGFAMLVGIWASRGSRLLLAPFFDKIKINRLVPTLQLLGAIGYLINT